MKINLDQHEIQKALVEYINNQGISLANKAVKVSMTAGRGEKGHYAEIEITQLEAVDNDMSEGNQQAISFNMLGDDE